MSDWHRRISGNFERLARRVAKPFYYLAHDLFQYVAFPMRPSASRGVFKSMEHAIAAAPRGKPVGYDDPLLACEYAKNLKLELSDHDFPCLYHLKRMLGSLGGSVTILDFGGNVGVHYLKFRKHLDLHRAQWVICEVPEIVKQGREICTAHANVSFVDEVSQVPTADIVLANGSVQYIDNFADIIRRGGLKPRHILIGQVLLHDGPRFVTLQNGGLVYYPQHIFNHADFLATFAAAGFRLVDSWTDTANGCELPFHRDLTIESKGLCFASD